MVYGGRINFIRAFPTVGIAGAIPTMRRSLSGALNAWPYTLFRAALIRAPFRLLRQSKTDVNPYLVTNKIDFILYEY